MYRSTFTRFRDELDDYNDRRERLIKASRDITNASKKIIFLIHRIAGQDPSSSPDKEAAIAARQGLGDIQAQYAKIAPELFDFHRFERQVSPGLQEYIEALSFAHYLEHDELISFDQVQSSLSDESGKPYFPLTISDYILGLSDLTGELMRYAISGLGRSGGRTRAMQVCSFVRDCKSTFEPFTPHLRGLRAKQAVTSQSLQKIEDATYTIVVRTSEYDLPSELLDDLVSQTLNNQNDRRTARHGAVEEDDEGTEYGD